MADTGGVRELPDNQSLYEATALPGPIPGIGRAVDAVLRGLLQSTPTDRLSASDAASALRAALYGPGDWAGVAAVAGALHEGAAGSGSGSASSADGVGSLDVPDAAMSFVQEQTCALGRTEGVDGVVGSGIGVSFGVAGPASASRLPGGDASYGVYGWGDGRLLDGEASLWDRQCRREMLVGGEGETGGARAVADRMSADCGALLRVVRRFGREDAEAVGGAVAVPGGDGNGGGVGDDMGMGGPRVPASGAGGE